MNQETQNRIARMVDAGQIEDARAECDKLGLTLDLFVLMMIIQHLAEN